MLSLPPITLRLRGFKLIDRVALAFLLLCSIALGAACGLLFVYASDLPEIRALETYRPTVVTEIYADDGQLVGSFALQRRILMTYEQVPNVLYNAVTAIEDQHFQDHWGIDFPRIAGAALRNVLKHKITGGASTITMQLAGNLFLDRSDRTFRRKMQEMLLALQIERRYTKPQIFTMYCQPDLSRSRQLRLCRRLAILFWQARQRSQASRSGAAGRNGQWPEIFSA